MDAPPEQRPGSTGKLSGQPQIYPGRVKDAFVIRMTEHNHKRTLFEFILVRRLALLGPFGRAVVKNRLSMLSMFFCPPRTLRLDFSLLIRTMWPCHRVSFVSAVASFLSLAGVV